MLFSSITIAYFSFAALVIGTLCPQAELLPGMSPYGVKGILLAQFLENLEFSFFSTGAANISKWGAENSSSSSVIDSIEGIVMVSTNLLRNANSRN
jgi:hypothetical protein